MSKHYKGRVIISRDVLGILLGLPAGVETRIEFDPTMDAYHLMMRSEEPLSINEEPVTVECREGYSVPLVDNSFLTRTVITTEEIPAWEEAQCFLDAFHMRQAQ